MTYQHDIRTDPSLIDGVEFTLIAGQVTARGFVAIDPASGRTLELVKGEDGATKVEVTVPGIEIVLKTDPRVFAYRPHDRGHDAGAIVYGRDGEELGAHVSSSLSWARHDIKRFVPEGHAVVWCIGRDALQARIDAGDITGLVFDA